jgi:hypothetical protein
MDRYEDGEEGEKRKQRKEEKSMDGEMETTMRLLAEKKKWRFFLL